jgi:TatD DNase family protein
VRTKNLFGQHWECTPELVSTRFKELDLMIKMINKTRYIGEVGLDYTNVTQEEKALQRKIFEKILEICAQEKDKVLSVHTRKSAEDAIDMIGLNYPGKIILHWYSDNIKVLERAIVGGMYFSINYAMTVSNNGKKIINNIPYERIITESDGPFIQLANKPFLPTNMPVIFEKISQIKSIGTDTFNRYLYNNSKKIFQ